jgi:hypothetical protein
MLLVFAFVGFAGAGAALAVARQRLLADGERDAGLAAITFMFFLFGALCTIAASGLFGVIAFGGVVVWGSYLLTARRLGLLRIEAPPTATPERETPHHHGT